MSRKFLKGCDYVKLERINENQIRCTLDSADFHMRQMTVKELTYRSPKAKELFRELLEKAEKELDFDAEDMPLMIEAIPTSEESVTLVVTRVEDPEEFDPRFARFAPNPVVNMDLEDSDDEDVSEKEGFLERADEIIELVRKFTEKLPNTNDSEDNSLTEQNVTNLCRAYVFSSLDDICETAKKVDFSYIGDNSVYKDVQNKRYILVVYQSEHSATEFNYICNQLSEYSEPFRGGSFAIAHCEEHFQVIVKENALQILQNL